MIGNDDRVFVRLKACRHRPIDLHRIEWIDIIVDNDHLFEADAHGKKRQNDVAPFVLGALL